VEDHSLRYVKHFTAHDKPSKDRPIVLLIDNHDLHLSIEAIEQCKMDGVTALIFAAHCTHKLQPCYSSVRVSHTTYDVCITKYPGTAMTIFVIPFAFNIPLQQMSLPEFIRAGLQFLEFFFQQGNFPKRRNIGSLGYR
jgi:hypothetical protein